MSRRILFVHQNFPGQFPRIADALVARGDEVAAIGGGTATDHQGVKLVRWSHHRGSTPGIFDAATRAEADLIRGEAAVAAAVGLRNDGFVPDVIVGHPGWGETLHLKDIYPKARLILFGEFYYRYFGADINFDREFDTPTLRGAMRTNGKNATVALAYTMADLIVSPTRFQASTLPEIFRPRIRILHEGVDLSRARANPNAKVTLPNGRVLDRTTPVITFINRNFEPLRGFHIFMRSLPALLDAVPEAQVVLIGSDGNGYGTPRQDERSWREAMAEELGDRLDHDRVHFVGRVGHQEMIDILSIGAAHVYYTYPFTLSWSLAEAMACECLILASDTAPVRDAITSGVNGVMIDFFDVAALSDAMIRAVREPQSFEGLRREARQTALRQFDATVGVPAWLRLIDEVVDAGVRPTR